MRGLRSRCLNKIVAFIATLTLVCLPLQGQARVIDEDPSALEMMFDGLVGRPITLVATVGGAAVWLVTLPFSLLGGNAGDAADKLILYPAKATFVRCLGCKQPGRKVDYADELEDIDEENYDDDFDRGESEVADNDPYAVEGEEDFTADLEMPADDSSTLSYDETGDDALFDEGAAEDDGGFFDFEDEAGGDSSDESSDDLFEDEGGEEIEDYGF